MSKKVKHVVMIMICMVVLMFWQIPEVHAASAAKTNKKAISAYKKMLSNSYYSWTGQGDPEANKTSNYSFCCVDINKDGVKELIIHSEKASWASNTYKLLVYRNGKVSSVLACHGIEVYKKSRVIGVEEAHTGDFSGDFYTLSKKGKLKEKASYCGTSYSGFFTYSNYKIKHTENGIFYFSYKIGGKETSYTNYQKKYSKLIKNNEGKVKLKFVKNTSANRMAKLK